VPLRYEQRVLAGALAVGLPGTALAILVLWANPPWFASHALSTTLTLLAVWIAAAVGLRRRIVFPLQTVSNLIAALREGDFSVRGRQAPALRSQDTLDELVREVNELSHTLHTQRLSAIEASALLGKVVEEIDVALFTFDGEARLKLLNRSAERLLNLNAQTAIGRSAQELGLSEYLQEGRRRVLEATFPAGAGRWEVRCSAFRQEGKPHQLLVLSDLTRTLREEELQAWQRIVRVIGHEINNSLTPIKSISGSLQSRLARPDRAEDWEEDLQRGLTIIASRSESLGRFIAAYTKLARLPQPKPQAVDVGTLVSRVAAVETRIQVNVRAGGATTVSADPDQVEQVLINLIRNAADASLETNGGVDVCWEANSDALTIEITDSGHGLANSANLFVPFFTTKPGGSGIGLVLSRQIAEAHGGSLRLENRESSTGCVARLRLPLHRTA